jgi:hypothetical protein
MTRVQLAYLFLLTVFALYTSCSLSHGTASHSGPANQSAPSSSSAPANQSSPSNQPAPPGSSSTQAGASTPSVALIYAGDRTDRNVEASYSTPPGPNVDGNWSDAGPQVNTPWTNIFGLREVRVTDGNLPGGPFGEAARGPIAYWINYFSAYDPSIGGYYFDVPIDDGAGYKLYTINPSTMNVTPVCRAWPNCNMPYAYNWSFSTPGLMYFFSGTKIESYNYDVPGSAPTTIYDFSTCPGLSGQGNLGNVYPNRAGTVFGVTVGPSILASFNPTNGKCFWMSSMTGEVGGTDNPEPVQTNFPSPGYPLHAAETSMPGNWAMLVPACNPPACPAIFNVFWQIFDNSGNETTTPQLCAVFGGCAGHITLGGSEAFYVISAPQISGVSIAPHYDFGLFLMIELAGGSDSSGPYTRLHPVGPPYFNAFDLNDNCNVTDTHPAWNANDGSDTMPIVVSSFVDESTIYPLMSIQCAWDHEIDAIAADGSGTTYRLAHNHATGLSQPGAALATSYNALSMPVESPDGRLVLWATDWDSLLGEQIGAETYKRTDVFIVNVSSVVSPPVKGSLGR